MKEDPKLKKKLLGGQKIKATRLEKGVNVENLVDGYFQAYNSARLGEACQLLSKKMLDPKNDVTIGLTLAGALTPAGISGMLVSMMEAGFIDFVISTGANIYHDIHFALGLDLHKGVFNIDDTTLWNNGIVRIYDIFMGSDTLIKTDRFLERILAFDKDRPTGSISSRELHNYIGHKLLKEAKFPENSFLAQAAKYNVPVYTSSPGDSTLGMNLATYVLDGSRNLTQDPNKDVLETTAIVMAAKQNGAILLGGGSPKNFYMQTQPMLWECLGIEKGGHDYFIQITMDSPQWGGLSGATPSEAVSWGKINLEELQNTVVVYTDTTIATPILFSYAFSKNKPRKRKELYGKMDKMMADLKKEFKGIEWWPEYEKDRK